MRLPLKLHPDSHCPAVTSLTVDVSRDGPTLSLRYELTGDLGALALPGETLPMRTVELWKSTCFEAFVRMDGEAYFEFNVAPSTQWAVYRFDSYRRGMSVAYEIPLPDFDVERSADRFVIATTLAMPNRPGPWRVGLSAVIEGGAGEKSHWALAHAPGKPDFHHAEAFAIELAEQS
jgi:hypothetical protein